MKFVLIDAILRIWSKKLNFSNFSGKKVYLWNRKNSEVHYHVIHKDIHKRQQCFRKKEKIKRLNQKSLNRLQRQTDGVFNHLPYLKIPCSTVNSSVKLQGQTFSEKYLWGEQYTPEIPCSSVWAASHLYWVDQAWAMAPPLLSLTVLPCLFKK